jgi:hypothetical protein
VVNDRDGTSEHLLASNPETVTNPYGARALTIGVAAIVVFILVVIWLFAAGRAGPVPETGVPATEPTSSSSAVTSPGSGLSTAGGPSPRITPTGDPNQVPSTLPGTAPTKIETMTAIPTS